MAGKNELTTPVFKTMNIDGDKNVVLINIRPSFKENQSILLHFRETEGLSGKISLSSEVAGRPVRSLKQVTVAGETIQKLDKDISFKPHEVKFIEVEF